MRYCPVETFYLFMAVLGLRCCVDFSLVSVHSLVTVVASLVTKTSHSVTPQPSTQLSHLSPSFVPKLH